MSQHDPLCHSTHEAPSKLIPVAGREANALRVVGLHLQIAALKALKLNIRRAKVKTKGNTKVNKFYITDATTAEKIMKVLQTSSLNPFLHCLLAGSPVI